MKKTILSLAALAMLASCNNTKDEASASTTADKQTESTASASANNYTVDTATSTVAWMGYGAGIKKHDGNFKLNKGSFAVENGMISSGNFEINIKSMTNNDVPADQGKGKLVGHLLSPDFFDAEKYNTATFAITKCEALTGDSNYNHTVSGNLTLKDSTVNVSFPAKIDITDASVQAKANFKIDRTKWGMHYGNDKSLGDKFISPDVSITLDIKGKK